MSSHRRRHALQRQPPKGEPLNAEQDAEVIEGVGSGAKTVDGDCFVDDVEEPMYAQRSNVVATPSGEDLFPLAFNCNFLCGQRVDIDIY